jgi:branched-chain amino acid transport system substrate-binding protein
LAVLVVVAAACGSSSKSSGASGGSSGGGGGKASSTITIGLITSQTGSASPTYANVAKAAQARVAALNAAGGVNGHQLKLITTDDTSTPIGNATAAKDLVSQGVFGVVEVSAFGFAAARYLNQQAIPVTGAGTDGTEWGQQPNTNMFSLSAVLSDPHYPQYTQPAQFLKDNGVTTVASFGYGDSPSSADAAKGLAFAAKHVGLKVGYLNTSIPFGSVNVTPIALAMKQAGVNGAYMPLDDNTNFALITAARQAGVNLKVAISATGYGQSLLNDSSAVQSGQGVYFPPIGAPVELHTAATEAMQKAFASYAQFTGVPGFDWYEGWMSTDLMIKGLQLAGTNPTRPSFINNLRQVSSYDAGGLLPTPVNFTLAAFGKAPSQSCTYYTVLRGSQFVVAPADGKPVCGTLIPNSNQA